MPNRLRKIPDPNDQDVPLHKIIVVDDEEDIVLALRGLFDSIDENIETLYSTDPLEVESIIRENPEVEVIITDIRMPNLSGLDLMVRVQQEHPNIKFIVMTGFSSPELRTRSYGLGAVHYIEKPFDFELLRREVTNILSDKDKSGFEGIVGQLHMAEVIQLLGISGRKSTLKVNSGRNEGIIAIDNGIIIHAKTVANVGVDAFYEMFQWPGGKFTVGPYVRTQKTIGKQWQTLVIDAARVSDEASASDELLGEDDIENNDIEFIEPVTSIKKTSINTPYRKPEVTTPPIETFSALDEIAPQELQEPVSESKRFSFAAPLSAETIQSKTARQPMPVSAPTPPPVHPMPQPAAQPAPQPVMQPRTPPPAVAERPANKPEVREHREEMQDFRTTERIAELFVKMHDLAKESWQDKVESLPIDKIPMAKIPPRIGSWVVLMMTEDVDGTIGKLTHAFDLHDEESRSILMQLRNHLAKKRMVTKREWMELVRRAIALEIGLVLEPLPTLTAFCNRLTNYQSIEAALHEIITRDQIDPEFRTILSQTIQTGYSDANLKSSFMEYIDGMPIKRRWELVIRQFRRLEGFILEMGMPETQVPIECVMQILKGVNEKEVAQGVEIVAYVGVDHLDILQLESIRDKYQTKHPNS